MKKWPNGESLKGKDEWGWKETADRYQTSKMHREEQMRWKICMEKPDKRPDACSGAANATCN